jgi:hypothetical protein
MKLLKDIRVEEHGLRHLDFKETKTMCRILFRLTELKILEKEGWKSIPINHKQLFEIGEQLEFVRIYDEKGDLIEEITVNKVPQDVFQLKWAHIDLVLKQMREEGKVYTDQDADYEEGIGRDFGYNQEKSCFEMTEMDTVVGSFFHEYQLSTEEIKKKLMAKASLFGLRAQGFDLPYFD